MRHLWVIIVTACTDEKSAIVSRDLAAEREGIQMLSTDISAYFFPFVENLTAVRVSFVHANFMSKLAELFIAN